MTISFVLTSGCCPPILDKFLLEYPVPWGSFDGKVFASAANLFWCCSISSCFCIDVSGNESRLGRSIGRGKPLRNGNAFPGRDGEDWKKFWINWEASAESKPGGRGNADFVPTQDPAETKTKRWYLIVADVFCQQAIYNNDFKLLTICPEQFIRGNIILTCYKSMHCCIVFKKHFHPYKRLLSFLG